MCVRGNLTRCWLGIFLTLWHTLRTFSERMCPVGSQVKCPFKCDTNDLYWSTRLPTSICQTRNVPFHSSVHSTVATLFLFFSTAALIRWPCHHWCRVYRYCIRFYYFKSLFHLSCAAAWRRASVENFHLLVQTALCCRGSPYCVAIVVRYQLFIMDKHYILWNHPLNNVTQHFIFCLSSPLYRVINIKLMLCILFFRCKGKCFNYSKCRRMNGNKLLVEAVLEMENKRIKCLCVSHVTRFSFVRPILKLIGNDPEWISFTRQLLLPLLLNPSDNGVS